MKKTSFIIILIAILLITGCQKTIKEEVKTQTYFSTIDNLPEKLNELLSGAEQNIDCALYELNLEKTIEILDNKSKQIKVRLIMDDENALKKEYVRKDDNGLMHDKFCIIDSKITWTGSYNPTGNNNNENMIILNSKQISKIYEQEFEEMWKGTFKSGKKTNMIIKTGNKSYQPAFCPEDNCEDKVLNELNKAEKSIYFMTFSFTSKPISELLVQKKKQELDIKGVWEERRTEMEYEKYNYLANKGIDIKKDENKYIMHHKVFIIDNQTVITGSYNPTNNGNENNDENILIIHDKEIADRYLEEFERLYKK
jgi:phosphatidylserine/phosphatidylglycerophosphate/cardiolipin synthase-like enzyme